jgi:hypothetical protein
VTHIRLALQLLAAISGTALVMAAWSEFVFYNEGPAEALISALDQGVLTGISFLVEMGLFYLIPSTCLVGLVGLFGGVGTARILLIGALVGYSIEGAMVPAVYEAVPLSYLWTSVAWHGPITVALGVFVLPRLMAENPVFKMAIRSALLGIAWAIWTTWTWVDGVTPIPDGTFGLFALATSIALLVGYALLKVANWPATIPPRWLSLVLLLPTLILLGVQGLAVPVQAAGLFGIIAALVLVLRRLGHETSESVQMRLSNLGALVVMPLGASFGYATLLQIGAPLMSEDLVSLMFLSGMGVWVWGVARGVFKRANIRSERT